MSGQLPGFGVPPSGGSSQFVLIASCTNFRLKAVLRTLHNGFRRIS